MAASNIGSPLRDLAVMQGLAAGVLFLLIPLANLLGPGAHPLAGMLHGLGASLTLLVSTYAWHACYGWVRGRDSLHRTFEWRLGTANVLVLATIAAGNWLYIPYQAPEGASEWLKLHLPVGHWVVMEYKEFVSLLTLPLGVGAGVLLRRFGPSASGEIRLLIGTLLTFSWLCLLIGFVLGLVLVKWRAV